MGLATAKLVGKKQNVIIAGRNIPRLKKAVKELKNKGIEAEWFAINVADRSAVDALAERAKRLGRITSVINSAGMSPHMGTAEEIMETNALGTINMNESFYDVMESGSCIIDVSSTAAYLVPRIFIPSGIYRYSRIDKKQFMKKIMKRVNLFPKLKRPDMAYVYSKHFVIWYARTDAAKFAEKGIRILSVTPGNFDTPMGKLENEGGEKFIKYSAMKRSGYVDEIANLFVFLVSNKLGYLTGADIICDGGLLASGINPVKLALFDK